MINNHTRRFQTTTKSGIVLISLVACLALARQVQGGAAEGPTSRPSGPSRAIDAAPASPGPAPGARRGHPFVAMADGMFQAQVRASGGMLVNAMYLTRPWREVAAELVSNPPAQKVTVFQCRGPQDEVLEAFRPVADQFIIFLFQHAGLRGPGPDDRVWPGIDHPLLNRLREVPPQAGKARVHAIIHVLGEETSVWGLDEKRGIRFEEVQWMVVAVMGGDYGGFLWRTDVNISPWPDRLRALETAIRANAEDLGNASAVVGWVEGPPGQPLTTRCSDKKLFIFLLHPDYMSFDPGGRSIREPVEARDCQGQVVIHPPEGWRVESGRCLSGATLKLDRDGAVLRTRYCFRGGGEILILDLKGSPTIATGSIAGARDNLRKE
jgi:hypothetical protein